MEKEISIDKRYNLPTSLSVIRKGSHILVISVETANWIVLHNETQLSFLQFLQDHTVGEALKLVNDQKDAECVITQLEARHFEDMTTYSCTKNEQFSMQLYLTNACNLRCPHCYMFSGKKLKNELSTNEILSLLSQFKSAGGRQVTFTGGEIAMRNDLIVIVQKAYDYGLKIRLLTNGTLWTEKMIEDVSTYISYVQISIDGYSEKSNAVIRGPGAFDKALWTVALFLKHNVHTEIAITPPYNSEFENQIDSYVKFVKDLSSQYRNKPLIIKFTGNLIDGREICLSIEEQKKYYNFIDKIQSKLLGGSLMDYSFIDTFRKRIIMDNCSYGNITISSVGDVYMCARIPSLTSIGNVRNLLFSEILKMSNIYKQYSNINNLSPCNKCELKYICGGGCRIEYFEGFSNLNISGSGSKNLLKRKQCTDEYKSDFYDLMIRTNEYIFQ